MGDFLFLDFHKKISSFTITLHVNIICFGVQNSIRGYFCDSHRTFLLHPLHIGLYQYIVHFECGDHALDEDFV